ncbi:MAG TPA: glutathione S-transferase family protein [Alphaproteobacteria bacterium]|nr:glutathione S-transferase family protein [Alphaproteobacteria bacterium]
MIVLHGSNGSPFVARIRMQCYAKDLPFEGRPAALGTPEFLRLNPIGKMPVLEHGGFVLPESQVIAEYLEDAFPEPSLRGDGARERAQVRLIARTIDLYCGTLLTLLRSFAEPAFKIDAAAERAALERGLNALEAFLPDSGFAAGTSGLSLADCTLVPWLYYARLMAGRDDDLLAGRPKLARYAEAIGDHPVAARVTAEMDESFRAFMARWQAQQAAKGA